MRELLVMAIVSNSPIHVTLMMELLCSSKTLVLTRATWRNIPEDGILHGHWCENLKSYLMNIAFEIFFIHSVNYGHVNF
jgi:hypothetical protein